MFLLFASGGRHVHDVCNDTRKKDDCAAGPVVPTLVPDPDSRPTSMISRKSDVRIDTTRVEAGEEAAKIKEPISLQQSPEVVDIKRTCETPDNSVKR